MALLINSAKGIILTHRHQRWYIFFPPKPLCRIATQQKRYVLSRIVGLFAADFTHKKSWPEHTVQASFDFSILKKELVVLFDPFGFAIIHQLQDRHLGRIAKAIAGSDNPSIPTITIHVFALEYIKQLGHNLFILNEG